MQDCLSTAKGALRRGRWPAFTTASRRTLSLEDAARVDGCNRLQILFKIIFPISAPGLITTTIFLFINSWNNYIAARTYLHAAEKYTVPVKIFEMMTQELQDWGGTNAASFISYLPILLLYAFLSKYFIAGLLKGSSK